MTTYGSRGCFGPHVIADAVWNKTRDSWQFESDALSRDRVWRKRMNRVIEKQALRRGARVRAALHIVCWIWGVLSAFIITAALFDLLTYVTLG